MIASAIDHVLPAPVIAALRHHIIAAHRRPVAGTYWCARDAAPRLLFEQVVHHLQRFVPGAHAFAGAEWWFRAAQPDADFPFHFDRDEAIRSSVVSPDVASILYLGNTGGPTVILDATPARRTAPTSAVAVHPRAGRLAMFPGTHLHGVLPGSPARWPRITMLVNWWRREPQLERAARRPRSAPLRSRWRVASEPAQVDPIAPARLLAPAAWRELIAQQ